MRIVPALAVPLLCAAAVSAAEIESGVPVGEDVGSYSCVKLGGIDDGAKVDKSLCYT